MKLLLQNRQSRLGAQTPAIRELVNWLIAEWPDLNALAAWSEITIILTDDAGITPVNRATFEKNAPTDVISLTYRGMPGERKTSAGELFVNAERARAIGRTGRKTGRELALYVAHGLHHLAGASDRTPTLRQAMLNGEQAWLSKAEKAGVLKELVRL